MKPPSGSKKTKPKQTQFQTRRRLFSASPLVRLGTPYGGVPKTAYYTKDCHEKAYEKIPKFEKVIVLTFFDGLVVE